MRTAVPARTLARGHAGALLGLAFAILGGSALVTAGAVLTETAVRAEVPPSRLAAAQILVSAPQRVPVVEDFDVRLPERATVPLGLADRVEQVPGVAGATPDVTFPVSVEADGATLTADAHDWSVAALADPVLRGVAPDPGSVVLDEELADAGGLDVGDRLRISGATARDVRVAGVVDAPGAGVHLSPAAVRELSPVPDRADLLAVRVSDGADVDEVAAGVERAVGDAAEVTTGDARGAVESLAVGNARLQLLELAASIAGTLLILVGCITASALTVLVANQRRQHALLRAVGSTPRQMRDLVTRQATAAAVAGLVPGIALGYPLAGWFAGQLAERGLLATELPAVWSPLAGAAVAVLTVLVVRLAARGVTWRASRRPATAALGESQVEPRRPSRVRTGLGLALIAASLAPAFGALALGGEDAFLSAVSGTLLGVVGLGLAGPALTRAATGRLAARVGAGQPVTGWLAVHQAHAYSLRTAGAVSVLALAFSLTVTQVYAQSTLERASQAQLAEGVTAPARVSGPLTPADVADLAATDGIDAAVPMVPASVVRTSRTLGDTTTERLPALGLGPGAERVVDLDIADGDLADLRGETIALDATTAGRWGLEVGDLADLRLGNGAEVRPVVVATYRRGLGFGTVVTSTDLLSAHGLARSVDTVLVDGDPAALDAWAADRPAVAVGAASVPGDEAGVQRWISLVVLLPMLAYVLVAVASSLRTTTRRRRDELATLRVLGATPRQVRAMVTREAALLAALAIGAGVVIAVLPMSVLGLGVLARPWPQGPLWVLPAITAVVALVAVGSMRGAARRLLRRSPLPGR
ncbi:FtsX-like permease family protein [Aeromicrobium sp. 179-A 4D2 NHS]|uniref:FtsX-like permease family protein n=1 Tax=Aeromicrobium sp. 179-A 4D2 NHS TaxID=3142375 RepID=UPI0039A12E1A